MDMLIQAFSLKTLSVMMSVLYVVIDFHKALRIIEHYTIATGSPTKALLHFPLTTQSFHLQHSEPKKKVKLVERLVKGIMVFQAINNTPVMVKVMLREGEESQNNLKETARENIRAYRHNSYH